MTTLKMHTPNLVDSNIDRLAELFPNCVTEKPKTDEQGNVHVPPFRIFPTEEGKGIEIDIYRGQDKVCTVERDNEGKSLYVMAGKQTDIEIDFKNTQIKATVKVLPWGEVNQNTEI